MTTNIISTGNNILRLPTDVLRQISELLPNCDVKSLRLMCRQLRDLAKLRIKRVFISANRRDIDFFRAVATHEQFKKQVVEIVWDDARWSSSTSVPTDSEDKEDKTEECPNWFVRACEDNLRTIDSRLQDALAAGLQHLMPLNDSYGYYSQLCAQQESILESGEDIEAFRMGLIAFPKLQKITICPVTHRGLFSPYLSTPLIRSFPSGFNYPIPLGWPTNDEMPAEAHLWVSPNEKTKWRGFCVVTRELASLAGHHGITEFVIDVSHTLTGLNCHIFDELSIEYENFKTILGQKDFRRLDLALNVGDIQHFNWVSLRSGLLRDALAATPGLEHFSFHTNIELGSHHGEVVDPRPVSLLDIFPIALWPKLTHFGLSCFRVEINDIITFLTSLPLSIYTIELHSIDFLTGNHSEFLTRIRDELAWQTRNHPPKLTIGIPISLGIADISIWIVDEISDFIYRGCDNPFSDSIDGNVVRRGVGQVRHGFDVTYERPNFDEWTLMDMGYIKEQRPWKLNSPQPV